MLWHALFVLTTPRRAAKAPACEHARLPPVYFLVSSTPDRAARLPRLLETMSRQTLPPTSVVLSVAASYEGSRFANRSFEVAPALLRSDAKPRLLLNVVPRDLGPITKYSGAAFLLRGGGGASDAEARRQRRRAIVVVGDDDMYYGESFLEDYACAVASSPAGTVLSSGIDRDCLGRAVLATCVMGFRGVGLRAGMLSELASLRIPPECFLADDLAISYYLAVRMQYKIRRLRLRTKYRFDDEYSWSNSSINTYHKERKFGVNRKCAGSLRRAAGQSR